MAPRLRKIGREKVSLGNRQERLRSADPQRGGDGRLCADAAACEELRPLTAMTYDFLYVIERLNAVRGGGQ